MLEREKALKNLRQSLQLPNLFQEFEPDNADDIAKDFKIKKQETPTKPQIKIQDTNKFGGCNYVYFQ